MPRINPEKPQIAPRNRSNVPLEKSHPLLQQLIEKELLHQPAQKIHHRYQGLLSSCLPDYWHHRVFFRSISSGCWHLCVATQADAFKLRFLLPEVNERLNQHLTNPTKLKIHVNPDLWKCIPQTRRAIKVKSARHFSSQEAETIIKNFGKNR